MNVPKLNAMKLALPLCVALAYAPAKGLAAPILGAALKTFAVLGSEGVTNVPISSIFGNVGVSPGSSITGFSLPVPGVPTPDTSGQVTGGSLHATTALAAQAQLDLDAAILAVNAGAAPAANVILAGLGNLDAYQFANGGFIAPGTYDVGAGASNLLNSITLDGGGSNTALWRFRFSSSFIMSEGSDVNVINVGDGSGVGVYWSVESAATLDGDTLVGNVLARQLISSNGGLTLACGRLASAEGQVTLIQDTISIGCESVAPGSGGFDQGPGAGPSGVPEPSTLALFSLALTGLFAFSKRSLPVA